MNISNAIRVKPRAPDAPHNSAGARLLGAWRAFAQRVFAEDVVGNPLHEAWTADGEPLERVTPGELARSGTSRHLVVPHSRGR